ARQGKEGSWKADVAPGGGTALVMLALLNSGVKTSDKQIQRGLQWLRDNPSTNTYGVALETMVFCFVNDKADRKRIEDKVKRLLESRLSDGWTYSKPATRLAAGGDGSNTQYALLALHEAIQRGFKVDAKALKEVREYFLKTQSKSGGWGY